MKKLKLKNFLKLETLIFSLLLLWNCQKNDINLENDENLIVDNHTEHPFTIKKINFEDILNNKNAFNKIQNIKSKYSKSTTNNKSTTGSNQDFLIGKTLIKYVESQDGSYHSYNFPLYRTDNTNASIENLMLSYQNDNSYKAYIVSYNLTEQEIEELKNNHSVDLNNKVSFIELNDQQLIDNIFSKGSKSNKSSSTGGTIVIEYECCSYGNPSHPNGRYEIDGRRCPGNDSCYSYLSTGDSSTGGSGSSTGGSSNPSSGGPNYTGGGGSSGTTSPVVDGVEASISRVNSLIGPLNFKQKKCLKDNLGLLLGIEDFLYNNNSNKDKEFALKAIDTCNEEEVDFDNQIILDSTFENEPCLKSVYDDIGKASTIKGYLQNFDPNFTNPVANLRLSVGVHPEYPTASAVTDEPVDGLIKITFNPNQLNRPKLDVARTMIHEIIHAEMYRKLLEVAGQPNIPWTREFILSLKHDYKGLADYYTRYWLEWPLDQPPGDPQHQQMAEHFIDIIIQALKDVDNSLTDLQYRAIAWAGLKGSGLPGQQNVLSSTTGLPPNSTVAWKNVPLSERLLLNNTYQNFQNTNSNCQ